MYGFHKAVHLNADDGDGQAFNRQSCRACMYAVAFKSIRAPDAELAYRARPEGGSLDTSRDSTAAAHDYSQASFKTSLFKFEQ